MADPTPMKVPPRCGQCNTSLTGQAVGGLCATCLLQLALEPPAGPTGMGDDMAAPAGALTVPSCSLDGMPAAAAPEPAAPREAAGARIGRYQLLQEIGEGGFGIVYLADQLEPVKRRVALKILKPGMDTREVIARFEAERQALALMDHPNIARIFDGGATESGRPYFVMELVQGIPLTKFCDDHQLNTRQRLDLFLDVLAAVQHAHQKGIIHRDLKPSNILVSNGDAECRREAVLALSGPIRPGPPDGVAAPVVKVIDFGIAKAISLELTDRTLFTAHGRLIGTPQYMSPEQTESNALDVDTRSDLYSLGVVLYELLTGRTPLDGKKLRTAAYAEIQRLIREEEPPKPSTRLSALGSALPDIARQRGAEPEKLGKLVRGDLDWIVMKCLEKDRSRRYDTANGLAADLKRHLHHEPVMARPPSGAYKLHKAWRRNRLALTAAAAVLSTLILGVVVSTWQAVRATQAEGEQSRLRHEAEALRANEARLRREAEARATIMQANLLLTQDKFEEADQLIGGMALPITQPAVEGAATLRALGEWHALAGRWQEAAARFAATLQLNHLDAWDLSTMDFLKCGPLLIELDNVEGYERLRRTAIARFGGSEAMYIGERIAKVSLLLPADHDVVGSLALLAAVQTNVEFDPQNRYRSEQAAWASLSLALVEYRRDNAALAVQWCGRCLAFPPDSRVRIATARIILAMSRHQLRQTDAAGSELAKGRGMVESKFRSGLGPDEDIFGRWFDWLIARILLREATALIDGPPAGSPQPKPAASKER